MEGKNMKIARTIFTAAAVAVTSLVSHPEPAEAHHQGFWITGRSCIDDGVNLVNCFNESVWTTEHGALNCAADGFLPVFARYGSARQYRFCDFDW